MRWCETWQQWIPQIQHSICEIYGQTIQAGNLFDHCLHSHPGIKAIRSWAEVFEPVRSALNTFDYRKHIELGISLINHLDGYLQNISGLTILLHQALQAESELYSVAKPSRIARMATCIQSAIAISFPHSHQNV